MTVEALVLADEQGVIRLWNSVACDLFGRDAETAVGASLDLIVPEPYRQRHWIGYRKAWEEGIGEAQRVALMPTTPAAGPLIPPRAAVGITQARR